MAVVDEAMVARAHDRVQESNDPTAHAVVVALREAARKLGQDRLASATIFATLEPCAMCVGALLESDVETLVFAVPNTLDGAAGTVIQLAQHPAFAARVKIVSGIRRDEAEELFAAPATAPSSCAAPGPRRGVARDDRASGDGRFGILSRGEVSEWLMVPLSKSGVRKHRGFESRPLRQHSSARSRPVDCRSASFLPERSPSGLWRRTGNAVRGNPSRVRIPPSPPARTRR